MTLTFKSKIVPHGADDSMEAVALWSSETKTYLCGKDFDEDEEKKHAATISEYKSEEKSNPNFVGREQNWAIFSITIDENTMRVPIFVTSSAGELKVEFQATIFDVNK